METKYFHYPKSIQFSKKYSKFMIFVSLPIFILIILNNKSTDFNSLIEYYFAMFSVPLILILGSILHLGSFSDIGVDEEGILVEFLWTYLRISWSDIVEVKLAGSRKYGVIVVTTNNRLTLIHRLYSLFTAYSLQPGFYIHQQFISSEVLNIINKHIVKGT